ncbi:MAG: hypothetical protein AUI92_05355 [Thaumarchaeota archaeon 13_1_40CM_3_38_6]|nr:MAG: hypothetical protein AUI92_05355 [Thaumarchaeota archaeon 13_1_40CM_3_38_6]
MKLYLAHPILDRDWVRIEELKMEKEFDIELVNPFYDAAERKDIQDIDSGKKGINDPNLNAKKIVEGDLKAIDNADGIVALVTEKASVGVYCEIFYNSHVLKRPTYLIITDPSKFTHPWLVYYGSKRFHSLDEFKEWLK